MEKKEQETKQEVKQDKTRIVKGKQGYGYKYTELAQINEYLEDKGMSYYQYIDTNDKGDDYIMTVPIVDGKELTARRGVKVVDATLKGIQNPAQEQGSATTYARRYSLLMAFGLATEDDDAQSLTKKKEDKAKQEVDTKITIGQRQTIDMLIETGKVDFDGLCDYYKVAELSELTFSQAQEVITKKNKEKGI